MANKKSDAENLPLREFFKSTEEEWANIVAEAEAHVGRREVARAIES
jgi:hypothetical protein